MSSTGPAARQPASGAKLRRRYRAGRHRATPVSRVAALLFTSEKLQRVLARISSGFGLGSRVRSIEPSAPSTKDSSRAKGMEICTLR